MNLATLKPGTSAVISEIAGGDELSSRLEEIGFNPGCEVSVVSRTPFRGPVAVAIRGTTIALRENEASRIKL